MKKSPEIKAYNPGYYGKKRLSATAWADSHIKKWAQDQAGYRQNMEKPPPINSICFSRQIGVGALEIADLLSELIDYRVVDREIIEHMAKETNLTQKIIEFYDERYSGKMSELISLLISKRTFIKSDYARQLVKTVNALANTEPTIFVGRGTDLILPRKTVLSVRFICSTKYRVDRLANLLGISDAEAEKRLKILDSEQRKFFKTVYQKEAASLDEVDLLINRDHIRDVSQAAQIVACAFSEKFRPTNSDWKKATNESRH